MTNEEMMKELRAGKDPLELSIKKWTDIVEEKGFNDGINNCALCERFLYTSVACKECVIFNHTNEISCQDTPYARFTTHVCRCNDCKDVVGGYCKEALALAKQEVTFLESLKKEVMKSEEVSG